MKLNFINDFKNLQNVTLFLSHYAQSPLFMKKTLSKIKGKKKKKGSETPDIQYTRLFNKNYLKTDLKG